MKKLGYTVTVLFLILISFSFTVSAEAISDESVTLPKDTFVYTGKAICPDVTVKDLVKNEDYYVTYANNVSVGAATVMVDDVNDEGETVYRYFDIMPRHIKKTDIKLKYTYTAFNGKAKKPSVTVTYKGETLKAGEDYTLAYKNNKSVGKATVTIKGKGNFCSTVKKYFYIKPAKAKSVKAKKITDSSVKLSWNKVQGATEYRIYRYKNKKWQYVGTAEGTAYTVKKLNSDTEYKFRIRAVTELKNKTLYGAYSNTKTVRTKLANSDAVYISPNGSKYHRKNCSYISKSKKKVTCSYATNNGYGQCSRCF